MSTDLDSIDLSSVRSLDQVLDRTPNGKDLKELASRLGLLTVNFGQAIERPAFTANVSTLSPPQLSDAQSRWTSEFGRITEMLGVLNGQKDQLAIRAKSARAKARGRARRELETPDADGKVPKLTVGQVNDRAEEDQAVMEIDEQVAFVGLLIASATAAKEATTMYLQTLSREVTFRCTQMQVGLYG